MAKQIQWFPGHMAKALKEMKESTKMVDIILELRDARIPISSANPKIDEVVNQKPRLIVLTKDDLADRKETTKWLAYFESQGMPAISINMQKDSISKIIDASNVVLKDKFERDRQRGMKKRPIKAMVVGIPNVGKSTLMNKLVGEKLSIITAKSQTTRHRIMGIVNTPEYQIVYSDTPGVLRPNYKLQQQMLTFSLSALEDADVLLYVTDVIETIDKNDEFLEKVSKLNVPVILLINKRPPDIRLL